MFLTAGCMAGMCGVFPAARAAKAACASAGNMLHFNATPFFGKTGNRSDRMA